MTAGAEDIYRLFEFEQQDRSRGKAAGNGDLLTEDWAARTFAERYNGELLFCHDTAKWHEWTGAAWVPNRQGKAFQWARELAREMCADEDPKTRFIASKTSFAAGVERFCRSDPVFAVTIEGWDSDPWLLGTPGGTVDLRTGELREARREERITKLTAVTPADTPDCPTWFQFLQDVTQGDAGYIRFIQQWAGYCLTGDTSEQALCFAFGGGGNGKGVLIHVLAGILNDYALNAAMEITMARGKTAAAPSDVMRQVRARARTEGLLVAYETAVATCKNENARLAERLDGANLICRIGGIFEGAGEDDAGEKPLSSMTRAELVARAEQARQVLAALDDPEQDQGDGEGEVFD